MSSAITKHPAVGGRIDNLIWIDPRQVVIDPDGNPRTENITWEDLKPSIAQGYRFRKSP